MSKLEKLWYWQDFSPKNIDKPVKLKTGRDLLYEFVNRYRIKQFQVINTEGESIHKRFEIVYLVPTDEPHQDIENDWYEYLKELT